MVDVDGMKLRTPISFLTFLLYAQLMHAIYLLLEEAVHIDMSLHQFLGTNSRIQSSQPFFWLGNDSLRRD